MNRYLLLALGLSVCALVVLASKTSAQEDRVLEFLGVLYSHGVAEDFTISVGATVQNVPKRPDRLRQLREQVNVPSHYGQLVTVTAHGNRAVLWYRGGDGIVRNAVVEAPDREMYRLKPTPSTDLELRYLR